MARRNSKTSKNEAEVTATEAAPTEAPEEATDMSTTEEVTPEVEDFDEGTEESTEDDKPGKGDDKVDLTDFKAAVEAALAEKDDSTGDIPLALIEPVTAAYRAIDGVKGKNQAKKVVNDDMVEAMNSMDIVTARAYLQLSEHLTAGTKAGGGERVPSDPTEAFVQRVATLRMALSLAESVVPEGVAEDWSDRTDTFTEANTEAARSYLEYLTSDDKDAEEPEGLSSVARNAAKLALGKQAKAGGRSGGAGTPFTGERKDIGQHIQQAFADQPVGTFLTVAEIRKFRSEEYGDNPPSAGAISARLFPGGDGLKSTMRKVGIESGQNEKGNKGATKSTDGDPID